MPDTARNTAALIALSPDNTSGAITEQVLRDIITSSVNKKDTSSTMDGTLQATTITATTRVTTSQLNSTGNVLIYGAPGGAQGGGVTILGGAGTTGGGSIELVAGASDTLRGAVIIEGRTVSFGTGEGNFCAVNDTGLVAPTINAEVIIGDDSLSLVGKTVNTGTAGQVSISGGEGTGTAIGGNVSISAGSGITEGSTGNINLNVPGGTDIGVYYDEFYVNVGNNGNCIVNAGQVTITADAINLVGETYMKPGGYTNAAAPNGTLFYSTDNAKLCFKDLGGTVRELY